MDFMWKQWAGKQYRGFAALFLLAAVFLTLSACGRGEHEEEALMMRAENAEDVDEEAPTLALVLTSRDGAENDED